MKQSTMSPICEWLKNSRESVKHETVVKCSNKCVMSNALVGTEDGVLFEETGSLDINNSNGECDSSDDNFRRFCYK
jgi:hypothetical protein